MHDYALGISFLYHCIPPAAVYAWYAALKQLSAFVMIIGFEPPTKGNVSELVY